MRPLKHMEVDVRRSGATRWPRETPCGLLQYLLARQGKPRTVYSGGVPELSRFFGIIIRMFMEIGAPHHRPHFHAAYQDANAVFALDPIECIGGELPRTQQRLVEAWAEIHRAELLQAWARLQSGRPPLKIEPLH